MIRAIHKRDNLYTGYREDGTTIDMKALYQTYDGKLEVLRGKADIKAGYARRVPIPSVRYNGEKVKIVKQISRSWLDKLRLN